MISLNREQIFNLVFIFVTTVALGMLLGLSVLRTVDQRLTDVTIKIPEIKIPEPHITIELPETDKKQTLPSTACQLVNEYPNFSISKEKTTKKNSNSNNNNNSNNNTNRNNNINRNNNTNRNNDNNSNGNNGNTDNNTRSGNKASLEGSFRKLSYPVHQQKGGVAPCYRNIERSESDSDSLRKELLIQEHPDPLDHPDFVKNRDIECRERVLSQRQNNSTHVGDIWPRDPANFDLVKMGSQYINNPKTHQWVTDTNTNNANTDNNVGNVNMNAQTNEKSRNQGQYLDRPWKGALGEEVPPPWKGMVRGLDNSGVTQHYKAPIDMTDRQRIKFMLAAKFDKMTTVDYRNWLLLYRDSKNDLAPYHRQMLNMVLNGYQLTNDDLPVERQLPLGAKQMFEERMTQ